MINHSRSSLVNALENQLRRIDARSTHLQSQSNRIAIIRLGAFLGGGFLVYLSFLTDIDWLILCASALFIAGFVFLIRIHSRIDSAREAFEGWGKIRSHHLARTRLNWGKLPLKKAHLETPGDHPYARDLDITGERSLLQLVDTAIYPGGTALLKNWMLNDKTKRTTIKKRHDIVKELASKPHFRDRLKLKAMLVEQHHSDKDWDMDQLLKWLRHSRKGSYIKSLVLLGSLAAVNLVLLILWITGHLPPYVIFSFIAYLLIYNFNIEKIKGLFNEAYQIEKLLNEFSSILVYLETFSYKQAPHLESFCELYHDTEHSPSRYLKRIVRLAMAASAQKNDILRPIINALVPWDLYFSHRLNRYKEELEPKLRQWLDRFYELEALCSLANFAWLNPDYTFSMPASLVSTREAGLPVFRAKDMGHPLIPESKKVTNDFEISEIGTLFLVTGSNMSGKSTFLRTVGINICLCFAGGPVNARRLDTIPFRLFSSINITDSLNEGLSHFYAEVKRLRHMLDALNADSTTPLLFLVDEIFRGTNNRERLEGSETFLEKVADRNGVGLISTHDLELTNLEGEVPGLRNVHFQETIEDGRMKFDYTLRPGPCPTTNALKIMEMEGLL